MWRRGANLEGDTANFIETEQLLEFEGFRSSFLQVCFLKHDFQLNCISMGFTSCLANKDIVMFLPCLNECYSCFLVVQQ